VYLAAMEKITNAKKKQIAEKLYIYNDQSQKEIADDLGVSEKTLTKWKKEGKWDDIKAAHTSGTDELIKALLEENLAITRDAKAEKRRLTSKEVDIMSKNVKAITTLNKDVTLVTIIMVFKRYNKWLVELAPDVAAANTEFQRKFLYSLNSDE
jgi:transposase